MKADKSKVSSTTDKNDFVATSADRREHGHQKEIAMKAVVDAGKNVKENIDKVKEIGKKYGIPKEVVDREIRHALLPLFSKLGGKTQ